MVDLSSQASQHSCCAQLRSECVKLRSTCCKAPRTIRSDQGSGTGLKLTAMSIACVYVLLLLLGPQARKRQVWRDTDAPLCLQAQDRFRVNLFKVFSPLQRFARSDLWPDVINFKLTAYIYPAYVLLLLLGPQERSTNFGLNLFWCYWWPVIFMVYPFLGRIWCSGETSSVKVSHGVSRNTLPWQCHDSLRPVLLQAGSRCVTGKVNPPDGGWCRAVCPFMIYGELVQQWRLAQGAVLLKWPHKSGAHLMQCSQMEAPNGRKHRVPQHLTSSILKEFDGWLC